MGGHTRHDYTEFFDVVPSEALGEAVKLNPARLAGPRLTVCAGRTHDDCGVPVSLT